jgi:antibiotic biosynthesis monooxygenase (ABM) superfamily enzyme
MDASVLYMVRAWVSPDGGERYLHWLEHKHMAEVIKEPGFLWARKCRLEQTDDQGWAGYLLIYGLESRTALEAYLHGSARERFWKELEPLNDVHRAERFYGTVDFALEHTTKGDR